MIRYSIAVFLCIPVGCVIPTRPEPNHAILQIALQPIFVTKNNATNWTEEKWNEQLDVTNTDYEQAGITYISYPPIYLEDPNLYEITNLIDWTRLVNMAENYANNGSTAIFLIENIEGIGAISGTPLSPIWRHGISLTRRSSVKHTMSHEIGHYYGLAHTWEELNEETYCKHDDCETPECKTNLMGYCYIYGHDIDTVTLTYWQISVLRYWATSPDRNRATLEL